LNNGIKYRVHFVSQDEILQLNVLTSIKVIL
jgi:hypothetical protein